MEIQELLEKLKDGFTYEEVDGKIVLTANAKKPDKKEGYFVDQIGKVQRIEYSIEIEKTKGVFPTYSSCEWFGLVMPQLLCKYKELVGGWRIGDDKYWSVLFRYDLDNIKIEIDCFNECPFMPGLEFPFPNPELAQQFLDENIDLLNKIKEVTYV